MAYQESTNVNSNAAFPTFNRAPGSSVRLHSAGSNSLQVTKPSLSLAISVRIAQYFSYLYYGVNALNLLHKFIYRKYLLFMVILELTILVTIILIDMVKFFWTTRGNMKNQRNILIATAPLNILSIGVCVYFGMFQCYVYLADRIICIGEGSLVTIVLLTTLLQIIFR